MMATATSAPLQVRNTMRLTGAALVALLVATVAGFGVRWDAAASIALPPDRTAVVDASLASAPAGPVAVIVQGRNGAGPAEVGRAVVALGGSITAELPLVDGVAATLDADAVDALAAHPAVAAVSADGRVRFTTVEYDEAGTASAFAASTGATKAWSGGNLGAGVGVAVIDTGVSEMADLDGRIVHGPDLSGEGTIVDSFGHGTVMAGLVAGSGMDSAGRTGGAYTGVAPAAHVVSVKVAGENGVADVSTLLQAMHWVSAYADQYGIRVLNLSWGTHSTQDPAVDPLNHAVRRLWDQGIVVVVAAGNDGPQSGTITKPGDDPVVLTVGAYNDNGTASPTDDRIPTWTSRGPTAQGANKPDLVAPGRRLVASRSFGSTIESGNPSALVEPSYIRGSGTSQATAVTSGLVALLLAERPELRPDEVKALLLGTADPLSGTVATEGRGRIDLAEARTAPVPAVPERTAADATGLGSIEAARGGLHVVTDCDGDGPDDVIEGEIDVRCEAWDAAAWAGSSWTGSSWTGSSWTGSSWTGSSWTGSSWTGGVWNGSSWTGSSWTGSSWTGSSWTGSSWTGSSWTGSSWTGSSWTGSSWTSALYEDDLFATAWWGLHPPIDAPVAGERTPLPSHVPWGAR